MAPVLTLHQGENTQEYVEHPIEVARRALLEAADLEGGQWNSSCRRIAELLPRRGPIRKEA